MSQASGGLDLVKCDECGKAFLDDTRLKLHIGSYHKDRPTDHLISDKEVREHTNVAIVRPNSYASKPILHIPDETGDEPNCLVNGRTEWIRRDLEFIPLDYSRWCKNCLRNLKESEEQ